MSGELESLLYAGFGTLRDVMPIALIVVFFQLFVLRRPIANFRRMLIGFVWVILGLSMFLVGLEKGLFPLGRVMAGQLVDASMAPGADVVRWADFGSVYAFAFCIGFATTVAEPALLAVALKAEDVSGGALGVWGLRVAVALGVGVGITLGTWRIVTGLPMHWFIIAGYLVVIVQTRFAPGRIIPLAYDSGGVTTSTVTVPLVAALGLGLAEKLPGRSALLDGFGLIAFASLFPMVTVMGYAQLAAWKGKLASRRLAADPEEDQDAL
ncbi:MAG: DUF1538 domain-containing protein [Gammaproteobacteria bacterium]